MKTLNDLKLSKKTRQKVYEWLGEWRDLMVKQADGREGNVIRADFEHEDFFFFTECNDILHKDPEGLAKETNPRILRRKQRVTMQLLIKTLMGEKIGRKSPCSHCGYEDRLVEHMHNGHFVYCPHCGYLVINGYRETMEESVKGVLARFKKGEPKK
jgi:DNA-directed RNA polymerase subunit RPC12/RpoP